MFTNPFNNAKDPLHWNNCKIDDVIGQAENYRQELSNTDVSAEADIGRAPITTSIECGLWCQNG